MTRVGSQRHRKKTPPSFALSVCPSVSTLEQRNDYDTAYGDFH